MFITGPQVIKQVTGESVTAEQLGGPEAHMANSGVIHFIAEDDHHAVLLCQKLLSFLPSNNLEDPPRVEGDPNVDPNPALEDMVPVDGKKGYDVREVIAGGGLRRFPGSAIRFRAEHRGRICAHQRTHGRA